MNAVLEQILAVARQRVETLGLLMPLMLLGCLERYHLRFLIKLRKNAWHFLCEVSTLLFVVHLQLEFTF